MVSYFRPSRLSFAAATVFVIVAVLHLLASCDGALFIGQSVTNQSPAGIYAGIFRSTITMPAPDRMVTGVISEESVVHLMVQGASSQYAGLVSVDGEKLGGTLTEYLGAQARFFGFDGVRSITLAGTVAERDSVFGDYSGEDDGFFSLDYSAKYERASSFDQTSGVWTFNMSSSGGAIYNVTLDIDADGQLFGTDTNGCVFSGALSIIDGRYNVYEVLVDISSCTPFDGAYTGLAYRGDFAAGSTQLMLLFANSRYAFSTILSQ